MAWQVAIDDKNVSKNSTPIVLKSEAEDIEGQRGIKGIHGRMEGQEQRGMEGSHDPTLFNKVGP